MSKGEHMPVTNPEDFIHDVIDPYTEVNYFIHNSYRILGMPVTASIKELTKRGNFIEMAQRTGAEIPFGKQPILPVKAVLTDDDDNFAMQRLENPEHRILDIFFWFWPVELNSPINDPALTALMENDENRAISAWKENLSTNTNIGICNHNLALYYLLSAIKGESENLSEQLQNSNEISSSYWDLALHYWGQTLEIESIWDFLITYINIIGDNRVKTGYSRKIKSQLPVILSALMGKFAIKYVDQGHVFEVERLVNIIQASSFEPGQIETGLSLAGKQLEDRIKKYIQIAKATTESTPAASSEIIEILLRNCESILHPIKLLYNHSRKADSLNNLVALAGYDTVNSYATKTDEWGKAIDFLEKFKNISKNKSTIQKIESLISDAKEFVSNKDYYYSNAYYELPIDIRKEADTAHELIKQGKASEAVKILGKLINTNKQSSEIITPLYISLAFSLTRKANQDFSESAKIFEKPRTIKNKIAECSVKHPHEFSQGLLAIRLQRIQQSMRSLYCMACGRTLSQFDQCSTIAFEENQFIICPVCVREDEIEMAGRRNVIATALRNNYADLILAKSYNPDNKVISKNIDQVKELATNLSIDLDGKNVLPTRAPTKPASPPENQGKGMSCGTIFWIIAGIIFFIYLIASCSG